MALVECAREGAIAIVTLSNPPLNLVTLELTRMLNEAIAGLAADPSVRVLVLTGSGDKAFCAGSDIKEFPEMMDAGTVVPRKLATENEAWNRIDDFPRPTIAALNGLAYGGGLEMAMCCDLIVAEAGSHVALPEIKLGVFPGTGGTIRAMRRIGEARAKEMMFFGEKLPVEKALEWGLINRVVPRGGALAAAMEMARELEKRPAVALQLLKQSADMAFDMAQAASIRAALQLSDQAFASADCGEGVRAFFEKRPPSFRHR